MTKETPGSRPAPTPNPKQGIATEAILTVSRTVLGQETNKQEKIQVRPFKTVPMHWKVSMGRTLSTGVPYEFIRVDVGIDLPVYVEEAVEGYEQAIEMVKQRLGEEIDEVNRLMQGGGM